MSLIRNEFPKMGDSVGYWSPRQTNVKWCEADYQYSHYISEFHNTWSSLSFILFGVLVIKDAHSDRVIQGVGAVQILMGIGTLLFHITQTAWAQALDEFPMMVLLVALLYAHSGLHDWTSGVKGTCFRSFFNVCAAFGFFSYVMMNDHIWFVITFATLSASLVLVTATAKQEFMHERWMFVVAFVAFATASCFWAVERMCPFQGHIFFFGHVFWHIGCAVTVRIGALYLCINRAIASSKTTNVDMRTFGVLDKSRWSPDIRFYHQCFVLLSTWKMTVDDDVCFSTDDDGRFKASPGAPPESKFEQAIKKKQYANISEQKLIRSKNNIS